MNGRCRHILALGVAASLGCTAGTLTEVPENAQRVAFDRVEDLTVTYSGLGERARLVIRNADVWAQIWDAFHANREPIPDVPDIDFSTDIVILAAMGSRSSGGYGIEIEGVYHDGAGLIVDCARNIAWSALPRYRGDHRAGHGRDHRPGRRRGGVGRTHAGTRVLILSQARFPGELRPATPDRRGVWRREAGACRWRAPGIGPHSPRSAGRGE